MRLYDDIRAHGLESRTAISNGFRYSSRKGLSWRMESIVMRLVSCSFPTKCLIVAAMPRLCKPLMYDAASFPVRNGSSEKDSKFRPPKGERCKQTVGANKTSAPRALASSARCSPTSRRRSIFQVAASDIPQGNKAAWLISRLALRVCGQVLQEFHL